MKQTKCWEFFKAKGKARGGKKVLQLCTSILPLPNFSLLLISSCLPPLQLLKSYCCYCCCCCCVKVKLAEATLENLTGASNFKAVEGRVLGSGEENKPNRD